VAEMSSPKLMKRILITACMAIACLNYSHAQQLAPTGQEASSPAPFAKKDFSVKVTEFDKLVRKGENEKAQEAFMNIKNIAYAELGYSRDKMKAATNEEDKKKYRKLTTDQRVLFAGILKMQKEDMAGNRKQIVEKLHEFADNTE
jgi:hypothetical protein